MTLRIRSVRAQVYRAPVQTPVVTSFGIMRDRPMVLVRVDDEDGATGWGEVWCNFPPSAPSTGHGWWTACSPVCSKDNPSPTRPRRSRFSPNARPCWRCNPANRDRLPPRSPVSTSPCGTSPPGAPASRCSACWAAANPAIPVYASGLNPDAPAALARARHDDGYRAFKLKVGFGIARDCANLAALRAELGEQAVLMVDANQGWTLPDALAAAPELAAFKPAWLEEPLRADRPWAEWQDLAQATALPLAAGENLAGSDAFAAALASGALQIVQPDVAKWGGITGTLPVARAVLAAGRRYCPHWLGGGVGLLASAHLLAAIGGGGMLEVDSNPNPLRSLTCGSLGAVTDGVATLTEMPGLGPPPDEPALRPFRVPH